MKIKYNIVKSSSIFTYTNLIRYNNKSHYFKVKLVKQGKWTENVSNKKKNWETKESDSVQQLLFTSIFHKTIER